ncbi:hypothetical protein HK098_000095 [Nowakowskiella sp. JEL0407]|nr:hypothetical protein HK098_000095 [Nowakowskiella sp. JEL0407]
MKQPTVLIPHYYSPNLSKFRLCEIHSWKLRPQARKVFDVFMVGNELDLIEIRLRELLDVVDKFVIIESDQTFTGLPKPTHFKDNINRFNFAMDKIHYHFHKGSENPKPNPFENEIPQRISMNDAIVNAGIESGDLLISADADEIPSAHTIMLLKSCDGWPHPLHLQLKYYVYSFEFPHPGRHENWQANVKIFQNEPKTKVTHFSKLSDFLLADSGWHCSFCLRNISDVVAKVHGYSHADRAKMVRFDKKWIQDRLCDGDNMFGMLPEEWTFRELVANWGRLESSGSGVNLPQYLVENMERFKFLLPGNCIREDFSD